MTHLAERPQVGAVFISDSLIADVVNLSEFRICRQAGLAEYTPPVVGFEPILPPLVPSWIRRCWSPVALRRFGKLAFFYDGDTFQRHLFDPPDSIHVGGQ